MALRAQHQIEEAPTFRYAVVVERRAAALHFERVQDGRCAICGGQLVQGESYCLDHCHTSGLVRGLLCGRCNNGLGQFKDDPELLERAAMYVRRHRDEPCR